jgi:hypothetical protein
VLDVGEALRCVTRVVSNIIGGNLEISGHVRLA